MSGMKKTAPEFLLIDAGNTRIKWAVAGKKWPGRIAGDFETAKVNSAWINALARKYPGQTAVLASVVPKMVPGFRRAFGARLIVVTAALPQLSRFDDFPFQYPNPAELGADRIAAAVAVRAWKQYPAIIVACGTATAFTVLDAKGRLCGGAIAPGLHTQLAALVGKTAQLPTAKLSQPRTALAKSTQDAIRAGVMLNFQGGAKEIIRQLSQALGGKRKPQVILTGGHASDLARNLDVPFTLRPLLVFEGLLIIGFRTLNAAP
jgi:type III pantothenate kinase